MTTQQKLDIAIKLEDIQECAHRTKDICEDCNKNTLSEDSLLINIGRIVANNEWLNKSIYEIRAAIVISQSQEKPKLPSLE